eukprot:5990357-Pyramimonas_sp.AAC.1
MVFHRMGVPQPRNFYPSTRPCQRPPRPSVERVVSAMKLARRRGWGVTLRGDTPCTEVKELTKKTKELLSYGTVATTSTCPTHRPSCSQLLVTNMLN